MDPLDQHTWQCHGFEFLLWLIKSQGGVMAPVEAAVIAECDAEFSHPQTTLPHAVSHHLHSVFWGRSFCRRNVNHSVISPRSTTRLSFADTQLIDIWSQFGYGPSVTLFLSLSHTQHCPWEQLSSFHFKSDHSHWTWLQLIFILTM